LQAVLADVRVEGVVLRGTLDARVCVFLVVGGTLKNKEQSV